jgi:hypothetical protein
MPLFSPVSGCPVRFRNHYAVHADPGKPVPSVSASWKPRPRRSVGVTSDASAPDHLSVAPGKPCARSDVAVWRIAPPEPAFTSWTEPGFPSPSALRLRSTDSVSQPRSACAVRYVAYLRERETPGQGVLSNPQGYPLNFLFTHKKHCVIHRSCTGLPTARAVDSGAAAAVPTSPTLTAHPPAG